VVLARWTGGAAHKCHSEERSDEESLPYCDTRHCEARTLRSPGLRPGVAQSDKQMQLLVHLRALLHSTGPAIRATLSGGAGDWRDTFHDLHQGVCQAF